MLTYFGKPGKERVGDKFNNGKVSLQFTYNKYRISHFVVKYQAKRLMTHRSRRVTWREVITAITNIADNHDFHNRMTMLIPQLVGTFTTIKLPRICY